MSYDVYIGTDCFNYTYNLSKFFHTYLQADGKTGVQSLDGLPGKKAARVIAEALAEAENNLVRTTPKDFQEAFDPENGWGSTIGAILWLNRLMSTCYEKPRYIVRVGC